jgi:hypothetical protein
VVFALKEDYGRTRPGPSYAQRTHAQLTLNVSCYHVVLFHDPAGASIPAHSFPRRAISPSLFMHFSVATSCIEHGNDNGGGGGTLCFRIATHVTNA